MSRGWAVTPSQRAAGEVVGNVVAEAHTLPLLVAAQVQGFYWAQQLARPAKISASHLPAPKLDDVRN